MAAVKIAAVVLVLAFGSIGFYLLDRGRQSPKITTVASAAQSVAIDLRTQDDVATLHAFALPGVAFTLDPSKVSFKGRPYDKPNAPAQHLDATIGSPVYVPPEGSPLTGRLVEYAMPVTFRPSQPPGMYHVELEAAPGFARSPEGTDLGYGDWSRSDATLSFNLWWPPEDNGDPGVENARKKLTGRNVYGYGGIDIGCPHWHNMHAASVTIKVSQVLREHGKVAELWTGSTIHWGNDAALHFFAIDPLRVVVEMPSAKAIGLGGSNQPTSDVLPCPALKLADFQIDRILSVQPPPVKSGPPPKDPYSLEVGMTRTDVAWLRGYPNELGDRAELDREPTWQYFDGPGDAYSVTFRNDRVISFTTPRDCHKVWTQRHTVQARTAAVAPTRQSDRYQKSY